MSIQDDRNTIISKTSEYLHWLTIPKQEFGNMPVCPYLDKELRDDNLYIDIWYPHECSFMDIMDKNPQTEYLKCMIFSPYEDFEVAGVKTRSNAPYFLINVAPTKQLGKSHKDLTKTKYFDNFTEEELNKMNVPKK